jgi:hypothetical protein
LLDIDNDTGEKVYASGVGLISDGILQLIDTNPDLP